MGAILTAIVTAYRNRIQPIGRRIDIVPVFQDTIRPASVQVKVTISDEQNNASYSNLYIGQLQLVNQGNKDLANFKFGITLLEGDLAVYIEPRSLDRHHQVTQLTPTTLSQPQSAIDFTLQPFNRRDIYSFQLLIVTPDGKQQPSEVYISSPEAIRFVDIPTFSETLTEIARSAIIEVGPLTLSARVNKQ